MNPYDEGIRIPESTTNGIPIFKTLDQFQVCGLQGLWRLSWLPQQLPMPKLGSTPLTPLVVSTPYLLPECKLSLDALDALSSTRPVSPSPSCSSPQTLDGRQIRTQGAGAGAGAYSYPDTLIPYSVPIPYPTRACPKPVRWMQLQLSCDQQCQLCTTRSYTGTYPYIHIQPSGPLHLWGFRMPPFPLASPDPAS